MDPRPNPNPDPNPSLDPLGQFVVGGLKSVRGIGCDAGIDEEYPDIKPLTDYSTVSDHECSDENCHAHAKPEVEEEIVDFLPCNSIKMDRVVKPRTSRHGKQKKGKKKKRDKKEVDGVERPSGGLFKYVFKELRQSWSENSPPHLKPKQGDDPPDLEAGIADDVDGEEEEQKQPCLTQCVEGSNEWAAWWNGTQVAAFVNIKLVFLSVGIYAS